MPLTLMYFHDPMCSWCWAFAPVWKKVRENLPDHLQLEYIVGGLAADSDEPMPTDMQRYLQTIWQRIKNTIPGTEFNFDFWSNCQPRRSTYPACRAVLAARNLDAVKEQSMITAIQHAYYLHAKNPSNIKILQECAVNVGLNKDKFTHLVESKEIEQQLINNIASYQKYSAAGFPSLVLKSKTEHKQIAIDYNDASSILAQLNVSRR